jgi:hypothetical protein|tara:strand:- start:47 stop:316 length:270 start_codon:yes stop_codon:yes gene_type:complete
MSQIDVDLRGMVYHTVGTKITSSRLKLERGKSEDAENNKLILIEELSALGNHERITRIVDELGNYRWRDIEGIGEFKKAYDEIMGGWQE